MKHILLTVPEEYRDRVKYTPKVAQENRWAYTWERVRALWRPLYYCESLDDLSRNRDKLARGNGRVALRSLEIIDKKQQRVGIAPISNLNQRNYYSLELALADATGIITLNYAFSTKTEDGVENTSANVKDPLIFSENGDTLEIFIAELDQGRLRVNKPWHVRNDRHYDRTRLL